MAEQPTGTREPARLSAAEQPTGGCDPARLSRAEQTPGACDPARLSAYRDGELDLAERQQVAFHLAACAACQSRLHEYANLAVALCEPAPAPKLSMMRAELRTRLEAAERRPWRSRVLPRLTATLYAGFTAVVALGSLGVLTWSPGAVPALPFIAAPARAPAFAEGQALATERIASGNAAARPCAQPLPGLSLVISQRPRLQGVLGCATDAARVLGVVSQSFEHGSLLRRGDTRAVYVVTQDGSWRQYADSTPSTHLVNFSDASLAPVLQTPAGRIELGVWFQGLWSERPEVPRLLGGAVAGSQQSQGLVQPFEGGVALWDGRGRVFVLMTTGESIHFFDQRAAQQPGFLQPLPIPTLEASQGESSAL